MYGPAASFPGPARRRVHRPGLRISTETLALSPGWSPSVAAASASWATSCGAKAGRDGAGASGSCAMAGVAASSTVAETTVIQIFDLSAHRHP